MQKQQTFPPHFCLEMVPFSFPRIFGQVVFSISASLVHSLKWFFRLVLSFRGYFMLSVCIQVLFTSAQSRGIRKSDQHFLNCDFKRRRCSVFREDSEKKESLSGHEVPALQKVMVFATSRGYIVSSHTRYGGSGKCSDKTSWIQFSRVLKTN